MVKKLEGGSFYPLASRTWQKHSLPKAVASDYLHVERHCGRFESTWCSCLMLQKRLNEDLIIPERGPGADGPGKQRCETPSAGWEGDAVDSGQNGTPEHTAGVRLHAASQGEAASASQLGRR